MKHSTDFLQRVVDMVESCGGQRAAARELGIPRTTIQQHLKAAKTCGITPSGHDPRADLITPEQVQHAEKRAFPAGQISHYWDKDEETGRSYFMKVPKPEEDPEQHLALIRTAAAMMEGRTPITSDVDFPRGDHLLVITPADIHHGKLGLAIETRDAYNMEIAERRTKDGVASVLRMAEPFGLERIIVNTGNDSMHTENGKTTTSGTPQDSDGTWHQQWLSAFNTWVWVIEEAARYAPVTVVFDVSNHPMRSDWSVNQAVAAYFRNDTRVDFPADLQAPAHRKYMVYGTSALGFTHGDGAKDGDLALLMAREMGVHFGRAMRGYWITKHLHHKVRKTVGLSPALSEKDLPGVTVIRSGSEDLERNVSVEVVRSPSGTDGWHHRMGYVGALKAVEAFLFHHQDGQVGRFTKPFW